MDLEGFDGHEIYVRKRNHITYVFSGGLDTQCGQCKPGSFYFQRRCVSYCPPGYFSQVLVITNYPSFSLILCKVFLSIIPLY